MGSCQICNGFQAKDIKVEKQPEVLKKLPSYRQIALIQSRFRGILTRRRVLIHKQKEKNIQQQQNSLNEDLICYEQVQQTITERSTVAQQQEEHVANSMSQEIQNINKWQNGSKTGFGRMVMDDGCFLEGTWLNGYLNGEGLYNAPNGTYYRGEWQNSYINGKGTYFNSIQNIKYEGEWQNNLQHGEGTETYKDKSIYTGTFQKGFKDGVGKFLFNDGSYYEGQFSKDKFHGKGKFVWDCGQKVYNGEWFNGKKHGFGQLQVKGKYTYEGNYKDGLKNGVGLIVWNDGRKYQGEWRDGQQHGNGTFYNQKGETFNGTWKFGLIQYL